MTSRADFLSRTVAAPGAPFPEDMAMKIAGGRPEKPARGRKKRGRSGSFSSELVRADEKLNYALQQIGEYTVDPAVFLDVGTGLIVMRPNPTPHRRLIRRITYRIGDTVFGTPGSSEVCHSVLYSYRLDARINQQRTFSDIRASEAASVLSHFVGRRFEQFGYLKDGEMAPHLITALAFVFEVGAEPGYPATVASVAPDGSVEYIPTPALIWPPVPRQRAHAHALHRRLQAVYRGIFRGHQTLVAAGNAQRQERDYILPFVGSVARLLLEGHCLPMHRRDSRYIPNIEAVYISRPSLMSARAQEGERLHGGYEQAWYSFNAWDIGYAMQYVDAWHAEVAAAHRKLRAKKRGTRGAKGKPGGASKPQGGPAPAANGGETPQQ